MFSKLTEKDAFMVHLPVVFQLVIGIQELGVPVAEPRKLLFHVKFVFLLKSYEALQITVIILDLTVLARIMNHK